MIQKFLITKVENSHVCRMPICGITMYHHLSPCTTLLLNIILAADNLVASIYVHHHVPKCLVGGTSRQWPNISSWQSPFALQVVVLPKRNTYGALCALAEGCLLLVPKWMTTHLNLVNDHSSTLQSYIRQCIFTCFGFFMDYLILFDALWHVMVIPSSQHETHSMFPHMSKFPATSTRVSRCNDFGLWTAHAMRAMKNMNCWEKFFPERRWYWSPRHAPYPREK